MIRTDAQLEPGTHYNVPDDEYRAWPLISQSPLKEGLISMAHLRAALDGEKSTTDEMRLGTALHTAFLEPELLPESVVVFSGRRSGSTWDAFRHEHQGKVILTTGYYEKLKGMLRALRADRVAMEWIMRPGEVEVSAVADIEGVTIKGRCDKLTDDPIIDLKKVPRRSPFRRFNMASHALTLGYDIQAAIYLQLFQRERFVLMTVEDAPPHDVIVYLMEQEMIDYGRERAAQLLQRYRWCCEHDIWPGIADGDEIPLFLPEWARDSRALKGSA